MSDDRDLPSPTPCPECGGERAHALTSVEMLVGLRSHSRWTPMDWNSMSFLQAVACTACGHTTLYAMDPHKLRRSR
jgi:hypothetical protein